MMHVKCLEPCLIPSECSVHSRFVLVISSDQSWHRRESRSQKAAQLSASQEPSSMLLVFWEETAKVETRSWVEPGCGTPRTEGLRWLVRKEGPLPLIWPRSHDKMPRPEKSSDSGFSSLLYVAWAVGGPSVLSG